jgi:hypothetical protein
MLQPASLSLERRTKGYERGWSRCFKSGGIAPPAAASCTHDAIRRGVVRPWRLHPWRYGVELGSVRCGAKKKGQIVKSFLGQVILCVVTRNRSVLSKSTQFPGWTDAEHGGASCAQEIV